MRLLIFFKCRGKEFPTEDTSDEDRLISDSDDVITGYGAIENPNYDDE